MNPQITNVLEIVMLTTYIILRIACTCAIVWMLVGADITNGWKVFLIALAIIIGLSGSIRYKNPNEQCDKCIFTETQSRSNEQ